MPSRRLIDRIRRRGGAARAARTTLDVGPGLGERDQERVREVIADALRRHDTMTQRAEAAAVADAYATLDGEGRRRFLEMLARDFWTVDDAVDEAARTRLAAEDETARRRAERDLRDVLTPRATHLLRLFTGLDDGVKFLVDLRADLLTMLGTDPALADLDRELRGHLATLFDVGLLRLQRITWDSSAALLEKLASYEAVHAIGSWNDLKNRLDSDRLCYAFFHPAMPDEPLVFVEIALTAGIATELPPLLDPHTPDLDLERADTAVFYGISSCQPGLAGVNLGNALIKEVVEHLRTQLPQLHRFATLSPVPGFLRWLRTELGTNALSDHERELLPAPPDRVLERLAQPDWNADEAIKPALLALCARYLTTTTDGRVVDPVANFHLANGAAIERVNWLADPSEQGRDQSAGLMANFTYEPDRIADRAEAYGARGEVAQSGAVRDLVAE